MKLRKEILEYNSQVCNMLIKAGERRELDLCCGEPVKPGSCWCFEHSEKAKKLFFDLQDKLGWPCFK